MSLTSLTTPTLPFPLRKCASGAFFALPAMNGPLPAELKFKENTENLDFCLIGRKPNDPLEPFTDISYKQQTLYLTSAVIR